MFVLQTTHIHTRTHSHTFPPWFAIHTLHIFIIFVIMYYRLLQTTAVYNVYRYTYLQNVFLTRSFDRSFVSSFVESFVRSFEINFFRRCRRRRRHVCHRLLVCNIARASYGLRYMCVYYSANKRHENFVNESLSQLPLLMHLRLRF